MTPTAAQEDELEAFVRAVETSPHNLVSRHARSELRTRHLAECRVFAAMLPRGPAAVLDIGSGGGFPGLVVAILRPDLNVTLVDGTRKKVEFLRATADLLAVPAATVHGRAEELQRGVLGEKFDIVTARAVAPLARLVGWTLPFLRPGGLLYAIKGARWQDELDAATDVLREHEAETVATPDDLAEVHDPEAPYVVIIRRSPRYDPRPRTDDEQG